MPEIRLEIPDDDLAVLDGYCSATSKSRTDVIRKLVAEWSGRKFHEATVILRVAGRNPLPPDSHRTTTGVPPESRRQEAKHA